MRIGHITRVRFADGQDWLVSDVGVAAVTANGIAERLDLQRDSQGRITRVLYPDAQGESSAIAYRYDTGGRLTLVRALDDPGLGTPVAYDAAGRWFTDPISANFGAATQWSANNTWNGTLAAGSDTTLAFAVRESEIATTIHVAGGQGAVIVVLETDALADAVFDISGAQLIGQQTLAVKAAIYGYGTIMIEISGLGSVSSQWKRMTQDIRHWSHCTNGASRLCGCIARVRRDANCRAQWAFVPDGSLGN